MKATPALWVIAIAAVGILVALTTRPNGFDSGWVTAIATSVLAMTALVGIYGVLGPIQQEAARRRREHLGRLVEQVLDPLRMELESCYLGTVSRKLYPLEWRHGTGVIVKEQISSGNVCDAPRGPQNASVYDKQYDDIRRFHYPAVIGHLEQFRRDYDEFIGATLAQAQDVQKELAAICKLAPLDFSSEQLGCYVGSLALYVFDRLWIQSYDWPLTVSQGTASGVTCWTLSNVSANMDLARGTEQEMVELNKQVEVFIARQDRAAFTAAADKLHKRLKKLQGEIAEIIASEKLEGTCPTMR